SSTAHFRRSLHDALPIWQCAQMGHREIVEIDVLARDLDLEAVELVDRRSGFLLDRRRKHGRRRQVEGRIAGQPPGGEGLRVKLIDRKSTRLNSSHGSISY